MEPSARVSEADEVCFLNYSKSTSLVGHMLASAYVLKQWNICALQIAMAHTSLVAVAPIVQVSGLNVIRIELVGSA